MTDTEQPDRLEDGQTVTMADLRRLDPSGGLARAADEQLKDYTGLVKRTQDTLAASAPPLDLTDGTEEAVAPAKKRRDGLGQLGDRLNHGYTKRDRQR